MRKVELAEATDPLSEYAKRAAKETVVVTRWGKPVAAVVPIDVDDWEDLVVSTHPDFIAIIERSRAPYEVEGGISTDAMRRRLAERRQAERKRRTAA